MVQLRLSQPLGLVPGERFVIRANVAKLDQTGLTTIGGGRILDISNVRLRRNRPWTLEALQARKQAMDQPERWCEAVLKQTRCPLTPTGLSQASGMPVQEIKPILARLNLAQQALVNAEGAWAHIDAIRSAADQLFLALRDFHQVNPQRLGTEPAALFGSLRMDKSLFDFALRNLQAAGRVESRGALVAVSGWEARVSGTDLGLSDRVAARFQQAGYAAAPLDELAIELQTPLSQLQNTCGLLVEKGVLVRLGERMLMHREAVEAAKQVVLQLFAKASSFTTMDFRDALGVSRKYAVPLLDHLDKLRYTVRTGNNRTPGVEAKARMKA